jgi:hypothetical protein
MARSRLAKVNAVAASAGSRPERRCEMPGCAETGEYPAPQARDRLRDYYWFCLAHIRQYNAAWDYYRDMSMAEIEAHVRHDTTWRRPSWRLGRKRTVNVELNDEFGLFEKDDGVDRAQAERRRSETNGRRHTLSEIHALAVLDLKPPVTFAGIRARYRALVKRHHPDANGGDRESEERLKLINQAYTTLRSVYCP